MLPRPLKTPLCHCPCREQLGECRRVAGFALVPKPLDPGLRSPHHPEGRTHPAFEHSPVPQQNAFPSELTQPGSLGTMAHARRKQTLRGHTLQLRILLIKDAWSLREPEGTRGPGAGSICSLTTKRPMKTRKNPPPNRTRRGWLAAPHAAPPQRAFWGAQRGGSREVVPADVSRSQWRSDRGLVIRRNVASGVRA